MSLQPSAVPNGHSCTTRFEAETTFPSLRTALPQSWSAALQAEKLAAAPPRTQDRVRIEAGRLLDEVKAALDCDFKTAGDAAARLAVLLASRSPRDTGTGPARGGLAPWQKKKIEGYVAERLGGALHVEELAKLVSLSTNHFSHAFKESFGTPPYAFIIKARVERAGELLLTTSEGIVEIALSCGFADQAHLSHCFRRMVGLSPAAWRRQVTAPARRHIAAAD